MPSRAWELPGSLGPSSRESVLSSLEQAFVAGYRRGMLVNLSAATTGLVIGVLTVPKKVDDK